MEISLVGQLKFKNLVYFSRYERFFLARRAKKGELKVRESVNLTSMKSRAFRWSLKIVSFLFCTVVFFEIEVKLKP